MASLSSAPVLRSSPSKGDEADDDDLVPDMPLPNLSSIEGGDRVVQRKPFTSTVTSRSQSFSDIPENPGEVYPRILYSLDDNPAQDPGLQNADDNSDELAKMMDMSVGSGSNSSSSSAKGKGTLPKGSVHPSRGSEKHNSGNCQPCSFFLRGKCTVAEGCLYCHYEHDRPQRPGKKSRERAKRRQEAQRMQDDGETPEAATPAEDGRPKAHAHGFGTFASLARQFGAKAKASAPNPSPKTTSGPPLAGYTEAAVPETSPNAVSMSQMEGHSILSQAGRLLPPQTAPRRDIFEDEDPPPPGVIRL